MTYPRPAQGIAVRLTQWQPVLYPYCGKTVLYAILIKDQTVDYKGSAWGQIYHPRKLLQNQRKKAGTEESVSAFCNCCMCIIESPTPLAEKKFSIKSQAKRLGCNGKKGTEKSIVPSPGGSEVTWRK